MKKRDDLFNRYLEKVKDVGDMLHKEGYSNAECRYGEIVATILLLILDGLRTIRFTLCFLMGAVFCYLLKMIVIAN